MLELKHINQSFSSKIIYDDTEFIAYINQTTIVIGPSGSGKSTLFNVVLNINNCEYNFNNEIISNFNKKDKENFILDNISYASQKPTFISDLKMKDQIELLKKIYQSDMDVTELVKLFELEKLLDCYPNQLSGGEKSRFAFILALLKPARIYMFDEPTSALDDLQASHIVTVLNDLKKRGNIVIISTHDHRLIEQGDKVYKIENKKLNLIKDIKSNDNLDLNKLKSEYSFKGLQDYWIKMKKHHKFYHLIMKNVLALGIVIAICGIEAGYLAMSRFSPVNNEVKTNKLLVFKAPSNIKTTLFLESEKGLPFEENETEKIYSVKNVSNILPYLSYQLSGHVVEKYDGVDLREFELKLNNNDSIETFMFLYEDAPKLSTYSDDDSIKSYIYKELNEDGICVNKQFYEEYLKDKYTEEELKNLTLEFNLFIPVHNAYGINNKGDEYAKANAYEGVFEKVELPIKAIVKDGNLYGDEFFSDLAYFHVEYDLLKTYMDKYKSNTSAKCFYVLNKGDYICDEELTNVVLQERDYPVSYIPWTPNVYEVSVDNIENLAQVQSDYEKLGFSVYSKFMISNNFVETQKNMRQTILFTCITIYILIICMNLAIKLTNKKEEMSLQLFFREKGFTKKMIKEINSQRFVIDCMNITSTFVIQFMLVNVCLYMYNGMHLIGDLKNIVIIIFLIIFTEYFIPMCLEHYYSKEETTC